MKAIYKIMSSLIIISTLFSCISLPVYACYEPITFETIEMVDFRYEASMLPFSTESEAEPNPDDRFGKKLLYQMENSENLIKAYDLIADGLSVSSSRINISYSGAYVTRSELIVVYNTVMCDFPEYFWLGSNCSIASSTYVIYILPTYTLSGTELTEAKASLETKISQLTKGLEGKSDYKISKVLHDRICLNTDYVDNDYDQSVYGSLVENQAVCAGYARAYQLLLMECGIEAWTVTGESDIPGQDARVPHAWNIVKLDGEWYYSDITWDDQGNTADYVFYSFFNITTEQLLEDHVIDESFAPYMPLCSATEHNFFKIKNWETDSFNKAVCIDALKRGGMLARIYVTGDVDTFITDFKSNAVSVIGDVGIYGSVSYTIKKLGRGIMITLKGNYTANGDANGDLKTNMKDVLLMRKCLASIEELTEISLLNADMSSNSSLDLPDILALRRYLLCYQ